MTEKQKQLLDFIKERYSATGGISPSYDEMRTHLGLKSKSGVHRLVHALRDRGHIIFLDNRGRSVVPVGSNINNAEAAEMFLRISKAANTGLRSDRNKSLCLRVIKSICDEALSA